MFLIKDSLVINLDNSISCFDASLEGRAILNDTINEYGSLTGKGEPVSGRGVWFDSDYTFLP
jgi:hypothetical protein